MSSRNLLDIRKREVRRSESTRRSEPARASAKPLRLKVRRRRQRILMFCICFLCAIGIVGGLGAVTHIQQFAVNGVSVSGAKEIPSDALVAAVNTSLQPKGFQLFSRKNMFLYPKNAIETALASDFPRIKDVSLARASLLAQALVVTVREREAFATWCGKDGACFVMDEDGFIFAPLEGESTPKTAYIFHGGLIPNTAPIGQYFLQGRIRDMTKFLDDLSAAGFPATGFTITTEKDFTVTLQSGLTLLASFEIAAGDTIRNLTTAIEAESLKEKMGSLHYIDLRFGNRVYYK